MNPIAFESVVSSLLAVMTNLRLKICLLYNRVGWRYLLVFFGFYQKEAALRLQWNKKTRLASRWNCVGICNDKKKDSVMVVQV